MGGTVVKESSGKKPTALTGASGVYFVASRLAFEGLHAAVTQGNAPHVDIVVGLPDGSATAAVQVKTSQDAVTLRGRGAERKPAYYDWSVGQKAARTAYPNLFFAFVDLKRMAEMPDVFVVPSSKVRDYFKQFDELKWYRYWPSIEDMGPHKNAWHILEEHLLERFTGEGEGRH